MTQNEVKTCKKCNKTMILKSGKFGKFWACSGFPHCKTTEKYIYIAEKIVKIESADFIPTAKQNAIFQAVKESGDNLIIEAGPGCAKTSTMIKATNFIPSHKSVLLIAFNKTIASELQARIKSENCQASTLHSVGYKILKSFYGKVKVEPKKINDIILLCGLIPEDDRRKFINPIKKIMSLLSANMMEVNKENLTELESAHDIELELNDELIKILQYVKETGLNQAKESGLIDYDDMINLPLLINFKPLSDIAVLDESQDWSKSNLELISKLASRLIFVGDKNQSIYAFRGADSMSMDKIKERFNCISFPLDETFRIPQNIVSVLNSQFPDISLISNKIGGVFETIAESKLNETILKHNKVNILCAHNAPLVKPAYELIRQDKKAVIRGADISQGLTSLIMKVNHESIVELLPALEKHFNQLCEKFAKAKNKLFLDVISDQIETIKAICENSNVNNVDDLLIKIQNLFSDNESGYDYIFSSIHKSKGTEAEVVIIYQPELIGCKAKSDEDKKQAQNLKWVAMSRALNTLYMTTK